MGQTKRYVANCSFGKDSMASILLAKKYGEPLDQVLYCEVMFDQHISGEVPKHRKFIYEVAIPRLKAWGIEVTVLRSAVTYMDFVTKPITRGAMRGKLHGFPLCGRCAIQRDCKNRTIQTWNRQQQSEIITYVGIASDETKRLARLDGVHKISLLERYGVKEADTYEICRKAGLLSSVYEFSERNGCFFCPNSKERELYHLYTHHPDLWARMLQVQALPNKATDRFNRTMTFEAIDRLFKFKDN